MRTEVDGPRRTECDDHIWAAERDEEFCGSECSGYYSFGRFMRWVRNIYAGEGGGFSLIEHQDVDMGVYPCRKGCGWCRGGIQEDRNWRLIILSVSGDDVQDSWKRRLKLHYY